MMRIVRAALGIGVAACLVLIAMPAAIAAPIAAGNTSGMFRWWLPAAFGDRAEYLAELESIANAGFKGVEICINMADTGYPRAQAAEYGWGSQRWNTLYKDILRTANRLGLQVDTTISPAWPAASPDINPEHVAASKEAVIEDIRDRQPRAVAGIDGHWRLSVERWQSAGGPKSSVTRKTRVEIGATPLAPWMDLPALGSAASGLGTYTTEWALPADWSPSARMVIALGRIGGMSARLWVNGHAAALNLFTGEAEVTGLLAAGVNTLRIEVASNLGNQLIADGAITAPAWMPGATVSAEPYGLLGPVLARIYD